MGPQPVVRARFRQPEEARRAVALLRSAGIAETQIVVTDTRPGLLEALLPEAERSGESTVAVRGSRSIAIASRLLRQAGAQEVTGDLNQPGTSGSVTPQMALRSKAEPVPASEVASARAQMEAAAVDMNQTILAIRARLAPDAIKARTKQAIKEATVGRVERTMGDVNGRISDGGVGLMDRIKQNPMPAAMAGLGLTWLFMSKRSGASYRMRQYGSAGYAPNHPYGGPQYASQQGGLAQAAGNVAGTAGNVVQQVGSTIGDTATQVGSTIGDTATQVTGAVGNTAGQLGDTIGGTASQVGQTVGTTANQVRATTSQWASQAGQQAHRLQGSLSRTMDDNPLPVGIAVLGLGALVAALVPKTSVEDQLLAETHDRLMDKAQEVTQKVGRVAERAGTAAKDEAHNQSLA